jgi:glycosyltransferase involved in cell wall biosynthesis
MSLTSHQIGFVLPNFNDWQSLQKLIELLDQNASYEHHYFVVDDCSTIDFNQSLWPKELLSKVKILYLTSNHGHQKAIAVGLSYLNSINFEGRVIVMDSDGEDTPEGVAQLIAESDNVTDKIIFAKRKKRSESIGFRVFYKLYKSLFKFLTGKEIFFGNFSILPMASVKKLVYSYDLWNHYAGAVMRSKLPYENIPIDRGRRLFGQSTMNYNSLILHGLSAVSVFLDVVAVRVLITSFILIFLCLIMIAVVLVEKYITHIAIPGWASTVVGSAFIMILQVLSISVILTFFMLNQRTQKRVIPATDVLLFISRVKSFEN